MELDNRQIMILNFLLENDHTTYQELSSELKISTKTVGKAISNLQEVLKAHTNLKIIVQPKKGVSLVGNKDEVMSLLSDFEVAKVDTLEDRVTDTIAKLLNTNSSLKIQDLADGLYVSRSTMETTIKAVRHKLNKYDINLISNRNGLKIQADEKNKRRLMSEVVNYYWGGFTASTNKSALLNLNINLIGEANYFLNQEILKRVGRLLNYFMNQTKLQFTDYEFQTLAIHLAIAIERIESKHFLLQADQHENPILENTALLVQLLEQEFIIEIPEYEQAYIDIHISAIEKNAMNYPLDDLKLPYLDMGEQLKAILLESLADLKVDSELINHLILHLNAAIKRLRLGVKIYNPYTDKIKASFKRAFMISVDLLEKIEHEFQVQFDDAEIAYVTLHIQSFLDRCRSNQLAVILVCSSGYGTSKLLEQRINQSLSDLIKIKKVLSINALHHETIRDELVVSTIPIENADFPVIVVSPLMLEGDINRIKQYLKMTYNRENPFLSLLDEKFSFFNKKIGDTQQNVLEMIAQQLRAAKYGKKGILENAIKREILASTALNDFAMPHAEISFVNEPVISIYINPEGIDWNGSRVYIVFFFALNEQVKPEINRIYEVFNEIVSNHQLLVNLRASSSFEELVNILKEAI